MIGHEAIRASAARLQEQLPGATLDFVAKQVSGPYALLIWRATSQRCDAMERTASSSKRERLFSSRFTTS